MHGGATPKGAASANTRHGRYSKDLPERLSGRFREAMKDAQLLQLNSELALLDTRMGELLEEMDSESTGKLFALIQSAWVKYRNAGPDKKLTALNDLEQLIDKGAENWMHWQEIYSLVEQRRKVSESEAKRQVQLQQTLTVSQAMTLLAAVVDTIKRHVKDEDALKSISRDIGSLVALQSRATA